jgi:hypothetical protein
MFHVKHRGPLAAYRSWRHTRHVRRWRPFFEERRYWDAMFQTAAPGHRTREQRVGAIANQLRAAITTGEGPAMRGEHPSDRGAR